MGLLNCWNWTNCGRYPGGPKAKELGVCPAATNKDSDGFLGGRNGGRSCIFITGTLCGGSVQGSFIDKKKKCMNCDYYKALKKEYNFSVSSIKYKEYCEKSDFQKEKTPESLNWISKKIPAKQTSINAKRKYK